MGLFREAGRRLERFKQSAEAAAEADADYRCEACGEFVFTSREREQCPECGEAALVAVDDAESSGGDADGGTD